MKFDAVKVEIQIEQISREELISRGLELREKKDNISWDLGDLAIIVEKDYGPREVKKFAKEIGIESGTLLRYRDVARAFNKKDRERFKMLPWSAFKTVAAKENRLELLEQAADNGWSVEKLGIAANSESFVEGNVPPQPEMVYDKLCGRWAFADPKDAENLCPNDGSCEFLNK